MCSGWRLALILSALTLASFHLLCILQPSPSVYVCVCVPKPVSIMFLCTFNVPKVYYIQLKQHKFSIEWTRYFVHGGEKAHTVSPTTHSLSHSAGIFLTFIVPPLFLSLRISIWFLWIYILFPLSLQVFSLHFSLFVLHTLRIPFGWSFSIFLPCCIKLVFVNVGGYVVVLLPFYNTQQTLAFKPKNNQRKKTNLVVALNYLADSMTGVYIENKEIYTHEWRKNERREREWSMCIYIFASDFASP